MRTIRSAPGRIRPAGFPPSRRRERRDQPWRTPRTVGPRAIPVGVLIAVCIVAGGCGSDADQRGEAGVTRRDTAGVPIVFTEGSVWRPGEEWTLAPEPRLEIGRISGEEPYLFSGISRAQLLPDGGVLVVHQPPDPGFRIFDREGVHVRTIGRSGEGPGEFAALFGWLADGGRLIGYDPMLGRFTVFDLSGELLRTRRIDFGFANMTSAERHSMPVWSGRLRDGSLLGRPNLPRRTVPGRGRPRFPYLRMDWETFAIDTIALGLGPEWVVPAAGGDPGDEVIFSPITAAVAHDTTVFVSDTKDFWIEEVSMSGTVVRRFGRSFEPDPVDAKDIREYTEYRLAMASSDEERRYVRQWIAEAEFAEVEPAHRRWMIVDRAGNLWLRHWTPAPPRDRHHWSVFDTEGRHLGVVETPAALRVTEITDDAVVGVWTDELDVQTVHVYELSKRGAAAASR